MGTTSTLLFERPRDVLSSNFDDWPFLSVHFWGEKADGRWTLQIINAGNRHVNSPGKSFLSLFLNKFYKLYTYGLYMQDCFQKDQILTFNCKILFYLTLYSILNHILFSLTIFIQRLYFKLILALILNSLPLRSNPLIYMLLFLRS